MAEGQQAVELMIYGHLLLELCRSLALRLPQQQEYLLGLTWQRRLHAEEMILVGPVKLGAPPPHLRPCEPKPSYHLAANCLVGWH